MTRKSYEEMTEAERDADAQDQFSAHTGGSSPIAPLGAKTVAVVNIKALRERLGLTQVGFAERYGLSPDAIRNWEQNRRVPDRTARIVLKYIDEQPDQAAITAREAG